MKEKRYYCIRPFNHAQMMDNGDIIPCCPPWINHYKIGNINEQSYEEIWNGEKAQKFRESIIDGSFRYCNEDACPALQTKTMPVFEMDDPNPAHAPHQLQLIKDEINSNKTVLAHGPHEVQFCYDRSCNLSCPSCRREVIMVGGKDKDYLLELQEKWKKSFLHDAETFVITGSGDAFASPIFRKLLQTLTVEDAPNLDSIVLLTNGLLITKHWPKVNEFARSKIQCISVSIDAATEETYLINRRGGDWNLLHENLAYIKSDMATSISGYFGFYISFVIQQNNYNEIIDFAKMGIEYGCKKIQFQIIEPDFIRDLRYPDWETEWRDKAVHQSFHPEHHELINILQDSEWDSLMEKILVDFGPTYEMRNKPNPGPTIINWSEQ